MGKMKKGILDVMEVIMLLKKIKFAFNCVERKVRFDKNKEL